MTVTHNNTLYRVTPLACGYRLLLTNVNNPRNKLSLNRQQMQIAGFGHLTEVRDAN
ncbi:hypothetical protein LMA04_00480 [Pseudescherichia vulneris]|uniref:hypothetical protein n=1 Tax=Pseudescherichia vulneris TaxID=566 RepID=UPI00227B8CD3|nr:hypothetical protein [Pseudescherichia vulneris]WAH52571.1 hypothetical protein LMA04_00480 [Pseudescherichia vulneris]